jgi:hypothetical protein
VHVGVLFLQHANEFLAGGRHGNTADCIASPGLVRRTPAQAVDSRLGHFAQKIVVQGRHAQRVTHCHYRVLDRRTLVSLLAPGFAALSLGFAAYSMATEPRDQWREAAAFVASLPGCESGALPVNEFPKQVYAYYLPPGYAERLVEARIGKGQIPLSAAELAGRPCPLLLWSGHTSGEWVARRFAEHLGIARQDLRVYGFVGHTIILRRQAGTALAD